MIIGMPVEIAPGENRVALTPTGARSLMRQGHRVIVESGAGTGAGFPDAEYRHAGVDIVRDPGEVYGRAELIVKVAALLAPEITCLRKGQIVLAFHHLAVAGEDRLARLRCSGATLIGYEMIEDVGGELSVLHSMSEIAGPLAVDEAMRLLRAPAGGRKQRPTGGPAGCDVGVVILGAGGVGSAAARAALDQGARVTVLDIDGGALRRVEKDLGHGLRTNLAHPLQIWRALGSADILIGAVLVRGQRAPHVVSRTMVDAMKPGAVIVDLSIDQGGCVETSRPTTLDDPIYSEKRVTQYAVPNMASAMARTASMALSSTTFPFVQELSGRGLRAALEKVPGLASGVCLYRGMPVSTNLAQHLGVRALTLRDVANTG